MNKQEQEAFDFFKVKSAFSEDEEDERNTSYVNKQEF